jgi:chitodextrinase
MLWKKTLTVAITSIYLMLFSIQVQAHGWTGGEEPGTTGQWGVWR